MRTSHRTKLWNSKIRTMNFCYYVIRITSENETRWDILKELQYMDGYFSLMKINSIFGEVKTPDNFTSNHKAASDIELENLFYTYH